MATVIERLEKAREFSHPIGAVTYRLLVPTAYDVAAVAARAGEVDVEKAMALVVRCLRGWDGVSVESDALACTEAAARWWFGDRMADLWQLFGELLERHMKRQESLSAEKKT
jgi:hypothetical protein